LRCHLVESGGELRTKIARRTGQCVDLVGVGGIVSRQIVEGKAASFAGLEVGVGCVKRGCVSETLGLIFCGGADMVDKIYTMIYERPMA
jgi:hypothetical protein